MLVMLVAGELQESWNPMWTVSSILTGLLSFMLEDQITTGSLQTTVGSFLVLHSSSAPMHCCSFVPFLVIGRPLCIDQQPVPFFDISLVQDVLQVCVVPKDCTT